MFLDFQRALRSVARDPAFAASVVATLALGIGASTSIFALSYGVWLKPLPYAHPEQLVRVTATNIEAGPGSSPISDVELRDYSRNSKSLEGVGGYMYSAALGRVGGEPRRIVAYAVSADLFSLLGVQPALGRPLLEADRMGGASPVVVLSDSFWRSAFGGDPGVVGKTLDSPELPATIVGVMPPGFEFPNRRVDLWQPLTYYLMSFNTGQRAYMGLARLKSGVSLQSARAELEQVSASIAQEHPETNKGWSGTLTPLLDDVFGGYREAFVSLLAAVSVLLGVSCTNVAGLLLARQISRHREVAVRSALGATRWQLIRGTLVETLVLATAGGGLGILIAWWGTPVLSALLPRSAPRVGDTHVGWEVLGVAVATSIVAGLLSGIAPALRQVPQLSILQSGYRVVTPARHRLQSALVIVEFAMCIVLVAGGALMLKNFAKLVSDNHGFDPENLLTLHLTVPLLSQQQELQYRDADARIYLYQEAVRQISRLGGVESAAAVTGYPGSSLGALGAVLLTSVARNEPTAAGLRACSKDYFRTMRVPLLAGRMFGDNDVPEAVINQTLAKQLWPNESPLGKSLTLPPSESGKVSVNVPYQVVGVAADMRLGLTADPEIFVPTARSRVFWTDVVIRTRPSAATLAPAVRSVLKNAAGDPLIEDISTMSDMLHARVSLPRAQTFVVGLFAGLSTLLAAIGLYGVMSYIVAVRTTEVGIRLALGAKRSAIVWSMLVRGMLLGGIGIAIGTGLSIVLTNGLRSRIFGLEAVDHAVFVIAPVALLCVAILAAYVAGRRAASINPLVALRYDR